jgi:hypothetical protein
MRDSLELGTASLSTQVVLVGVVALSDRGETPAHAGEVRRTANDGMDAVEGDVVGTVTEAEAARSLSELEAAGVLDGQRDETSATGKGRPSYSLAVDAETVRAELAADERVAPLLDGADE